MYFVKNLVGRICMLGATTVVAIVLYVLTAVAAPGFLRTLQTGVDALTQQVEITLGIPAQYAVWSDMAGVNEQIVFILFYIVTFIGLSVLWAFFKRLCSTTAATGWKLLKRPFQKQKPAT